MMPHSAHLRPGQFHRRHRLKETDMRVPELLQKAQFVVDANGRKQNCGRKAQMYSVQVIRRALRDISNLPQQYANLVSRHIDGLSAKPRPRDAKKLQGRTDYSLRVGVYRILYDIDDRAPCHHLPDETPSRCLPLILRKCLIEF